MKRATTINELANNLIINWLPSRADEQFYVPVYEKLLKRLRDKVLHTEELPAHTLFITGQPGTGKSTALNFLADEELDKKFHAMILNAEELLDLNDIDIIDVLLMFGFKLTENSKILQKKYFDKLSLIQEVQNEGLQIEETNTDVKLNTESAKGDAKLGFNIPSILSVGTDMFKKYKRDQECRQKTRKIFNLKKEDVFSLINSIITDWMQEKNDGKELLLIIDGLEKIREKEYIDSIFRDNYRYLVELKCCKIIAIPISSASSPEITSICRHIERFILRLKSNPLDPPQDESDDQRIINKNKQLFTEIVYKRIDVDYKNLISQDAIDEAIKMSGGILRQFIDILYTATVRVRRNHGDTVSLNDVVSGWKELKSTYDFAVNSSPVIEMLNQLKNNNLPVADNSEEFIRALQSLQVLAYMNGTSWYEVNPLIEKTVEIYAKKL